MSRQLTTTVPSEYLPLDNRVTDADSFCNVRDLQVARQNHNMLIAKRIKRCVTQVVFNDANSRGPSFYGFDYDTGNPVTIWKQRIAINQHTKRLQLNIRATLTQINVASAITQSVFLYPVISPIGFERRWSSNVAITVTQAWVAGENTAANYTVEVPVPALPATAYWYGRLLCDFRIHMLGRADTSRSVASGITVSDAGDDWFVNASGSPQIGYCAQIGSEYRLITGYLNPRYYVDKPWSLGIATGSSTLTLRETLGIVPYSMSLYEIIETTLTGGGSEA
jgi:hypothetical protein